MQTFSNFKVCKSVHHRTIQIITKLVQQFSSFNVNKKIQLDATVRRHLFTAKSLYMFRASLHPSSGALKTTTATAGISHIIGAAASFQRGLSRPRWKEAAAPIL
jgi:hypothetical protein